MAKFHVKPKEALALEAIEQRELQRKRTERALFHSSVPRHKQEQHKALQGKITMGRFNDSQQQEKILKKVYGYNKDVAVSDAMIRD